MSLAENQIPRITLRELFSIAALLAIVLPAQISVCKPRILFDGPFWLDECITFQIVDDPSVSHALSAVRHGVDTNPPVFHIIDRGLWKLERALGIGSPRFGLRLVSFLCIGLSLLAVYAMLRRAFTPWPALAGAAAVWAHPDVVQHATDARFYAPLLLMTILVCLLTTSEAKYPIRAVCLAIASALLCTLHYFGILSLGLILAAALFNDARPLGNRILPLLPALAGPIALTPFLPWVRDQATGLSVKTWLDPFSFWTARAFLVQVLCPLALLVIVLAWMIAQWQRRKIVPAIAIEWRRISLPLLALGGLPAIIVLFSATVQSALRSRYAIPSALALAPLAAIVATQGGRRIAIGMIVCLGMLSVLELRGNASGRAAMLGELTTRRDALLNEEPPLPIVFAARSDAIELRQFAPALAPRIRIADETMPGIAVRNFRRYETDMVRKVSPWYPTPPLIPVEQIERVPRFHLISPPEDLPTLLLEVPMRHERDDVYSALDSTGRLNLRP